MTNELSQRERALPRRPSPVSEAQLAAVFPPVRMLARAPTVLGYQLGAAARRAVGLLPGLCERLDVPERQPLRTSSLAVYRSGSCTTGCLNSRTRWPMCREYVRANWESARKVGVKPGFWCPTGLDRNGSDEA